MVSGITASIAKSLAKEGGAMTPTEIEDLLWQLTTAGEKEPQEPPSREELADYLGGTLSPDQAAKMERRLAASPLGRERMSRMAGLSAPSAPAGPRQALLALPCLAEEEPRQDESKVASVRRGFSVWRHALPLAAGLLLALAAYFMVGDQAVPLPDFRVSMQQMSEFRSAPTVDISSARGVFYADSPVSIVVSPWEAAQAGLDFGLYRKEGDRFLRLGVGAEIETRIYRGTATFEARAADLVGERAGTYSLYVVIAQKGDLPKEIGARSGSDDHDSLADSGRRQVHHVPLTVQARPAG
jgi:hypothetical protein